MTDYDDLLRSLLVERFGAWVNDDSALGDRPAESARGSCASDHRAPCGVGSKARPRCPASTPTRLRAATTKLR